MPSTFFSLLIFLLLCPDVWSYEAPEDKQDVFATRACPAFLTFTNAAYLAGVTVELACHCKPQQVTGATVKNFTSSHAHAILPQNYIIIPLYNNEMKCATYLRTVLSAKYDPSWHCGFAMFDSIFFKRHSSVGQLSTKSQKPISLQFFHPDQICSCWNTQSSLSLINRTTYSQMNSVVLVITGDCCIVIWFIQGWSHWCTCMSVWTVEENCRRPNPRRSKENLQTPHRKAVASSIKPDPSGCETTVLTTAAKLKNILSIYLPKQNQCLKTQHLLKLFQSLLLIKWKTLSTTKCILSFFPCMFQVQSVVWFFKKHLDSSEETRALTDHHGNKLLDTSQIPHSSDLRSRFSIRLFSLLIYRAGPDDSGIYICGSAHKDFFYGYDVDIQEAHALSLTPRWGKRLIVNVFDFIINMISQVSDFHTDDNNCVTVQLICHCPVWAPKVNYLSCFVPSNTRQMGHRLM